MNRWTKKLLATTLSLGTAWCSVAQVEACGGRSGGGYGGGYGGYARVAYYRPVYVQPQVVQAVQPQYVPQQQSWAPPQTNQLPATTSFSNQLPPSLSRNVVPRSTNPAFGQAAPTAPANVSGIAPNAGMNDAQMSALQALGGMVDNQPQQTQPATATVAAPQASTGSSGNWIAKLPSGASVQLMLQADGSFRWIANNGGKTSSFQGSYEFDNGSLTLIRSNDNQKLAGSITRLENGFNFKLNGASDAGLNFTRG